MPNLLATSAAKKSLSEHESNRAQISTVAFVSILVNLTGTIGLATISLPETLVARMAASQLTTLGVEDSVLCGATDGFAMRFMTGGAAVVANAEADGCR